MRLSLMLLSKFALPAVVYHSILGWAVSKPCTSGL